MIETTVTVDDQDYTATIGADLRLSISRDGVWSGDGRWTGGAIEDCSADLGDAVYDALDEAISDAIEEDESAVSLAIRATLALGIAPTWRRRSDGDVLAVLATSPTHVEIVVHVSDDHDDCLAAAIEHVSAHVSHAEARWTDEDRESVTVSGRWAA